MGSFQNRKSKLPGRVLRLLAVALLAAVLLAPTANAGQSATVGIQATSATGVVTLPFEPIQGEEGPLYLVTYEPQGDTWQLAAANQVDSGQTEVAYAAFDPAQLFGGQETVFYYAVVTQELWERHEAAEKAVAAADGGITVSWQENAKVTEVTDNPRAVARNMVPQAEQTTVSLFLAQVRVTRETVTDSVTVENASPGQAGRYVVQEGGTVSITLRTSAADPTVTGSLFAGADGIAWTYGQARDEEGFLTVTGSLTVPHIDATPGKTVPVEYTFTVGGRTFTQNDGEINGGSPLLYFNMANAADISLWMTATTTLDEEGVVQKGDTVHLLYNSETAAPFHAVRVLAGRRTIEADAFTEKAGRVSFALSEENSEGYIPLKPVHISLVIADEAGTEYTLELPTDKAYTYVEETPDSSHTNRLSVEGLGGLVDGSYYAVNQDSQLQFTYLTKSMRFKQQTYLVLTTQSGDAIVQKMQRTGSFISGYTFTCSISLNQLEQVQDYDWVRFGIRRGEDDLSPGLFHTSPGDGPVTYLSGFSCTGVQVAYSGGQGGFGAPADGTAHVVDGDVVRVTITLSHSIRPEDTVVEMAGLTGTRLDKAELETYLTDPARYKADRRLCYYIDDTTVDGERRPNTSIVCFFRMPEASDNAYADLRLPFQRQGQNAAGWQDSVPFGITLKTVRLALPGPVGVDTDTCAPVQGGTYHKMVYWAPLQMQDPQITLADGDLVDDFEAEVYTIVRDGSTIRVRFATGHPVLAGKISTTASWDGGSAVLPLAYGERQESATRYVYTAELDISGTALQDVPDLSVIRLAWRLEDARGQAGSTGHGVPTYGGTRWAIRYRPLQITGLSLTSTNEKDGALYAKNGDTVTVRFTANHYVALEAAIAGKGVQAEGARERAATSYAFSLTLENGDLADLANVGFSFTATDAAGQSLTFGQDSAGVDNQLTYYAPLVAEGGITSGNARAEFAKNGDAITLATTSNHEARILSFKLAGREVAGDGESSKNPGAAYRIPAGEAALPEGALAFALQLEDPAGNTWQATKTSTITYDRSAPEIRLMTGYSGFTNKDVTLDLQFSDAYLDPAGLSCALNQKEQITDSSSKGAVYIHRLALSKEGRYSVSASAVDLAGNRTDFEVVCKLVIDKTEPKIELELAQNAFAAGFTLDSIISIREEYLSSLVCTLTDSTGLHDWALDTPIETEGKKTINITARDLSGNVSAPLTCDIYIDATPPRPLVAYGDTQPLDAEEKNTLVGAGGALTIALADLHVGTQTPDYFTVLELVDATGSVTDLLKTAPGADGYTCPLPQYGEYTLRLCAADGVGNETGLLEYAIQYKQQYLPGEQLLLNTPLAPLYASNTTFVVACLAAALVLAAISITAALLFRRRRARAQNQDEG